MNKENKKMTKAQIEDLVKQLQRNPAEFLALAYTDATKLEESVLVKVFNKAGFYCRTIDVNRWDKRWVRFLGTLRNDRDLCTEVINLVPLRFLDGTVGLTDKRYAVGALEHNGAQILEVR